MVIPDTAIINPLKAWEYFSKIPSFNFPNPRYEAITIMTIVPMVITPNTIVTPMRVHQSLRAAGYIRTGIKGSQGPRIKMINRAQEDRTQYMTRTAKNGYQGSLLKRPGYALLSIIKGR